MHTREQQDGSCLDRAKELAIKIINKTKAFSMRKNNKSILLIFFLCFLSFVFLFGCALTLPKYESSGFNYQPTGKKVILEMSNPSVSLMCDGGGNVAPCDVNSLSVSDYFKQGITSELRLSGIEITEKGISDAVLSVHINTLTFGARNKLYLILAIIQEWVAIVDLKITVKLTKSERIFNRQFAAVKTKESGMILFFPYGSGSPDEVILEASRSCFSELAREVRQLLLTHSETENEKH